MDVSEFQLIQSLKAQLSPLPASVIGIGDDCAVIPKDKESVYLLSTDCLVEDIHFNLDYFSFKNLGFKAMAVNLSDVAAMGGSPLYVLVSLTIPASLKKADIQELYEGFESCAGAYGVHIVGGDTCKSLKGLMISVTVVGTCLKGHVKTRDKAKVDDVIFVSGTLGTAALGLVMLESGKSGKNDYTKRLKCPEPQVSLGQFLGACDCVHALMDISDGLVQDLGHMMRGSECVAAVNAESVPVEPDFVKLCEEFNEVSLELSLGGGEDYQLLGTVEADAWESLKLEAKQALGVSLFSVGRVQNTKPDAASVEVFDSKGNSILLESKGFNHFS